MKNSWLSYLAIILFIVAAVFQFISGKILVGSFFLIAAIGNVVLNIYTRKGKK
jgi:hypothetical protein